MDIYTDPQGVVLTLLNKVKPLPDYVKQASLLESATIPDHLFADVGKRAYPIADPATAYLSYGYFLAQPTGVARPVVEALMKAAAFYGIGPDVVDLTKRFAAADAALSEKRANATYALPERRAYPLGNATQVALAAEHFPQHYTEYTIPERLTVGRAILKEACAHGINPRTLPAVVIKYATIKPIGRSDVLAANLMSRGLYCDDPQAIATFRKLANAVLGNVTTDTAMYKIASVMELLDRQCGLDRLYGTKLLTPEESVFNMTIKEAEALLDMVQLGDQKYPIEQLLEVPMSLYKDALGEDFVEQITDSDDSLNESKLTTQLNALPRPDKQALDHYLRQYFSHHSSHTDITERHHHEE